MLEKLESFKIPIALSLVGVVLIVGGLIFSNTQKETPQFPEKSLVKSSKVLVDVAGAVKDPGVYELDANARVEDAVTGAGGLSNDADNEYIAKYINMAQKVSDGGKIYIPKVGEKVSTGAVTLGVSTAAASSQVNVNSATQAELEALPGIGEVTASKIISGRPYSKIEDLLNQKIVSKSTYEKIKDSIVVN